MKKQRMTTEARSFGFLKIAIVLVMLVAMVCCLTVVTAAEEIDHSKVTIQIGETPWAADQSITMTYGDTITAVTVPDFDNVTWTNPNGVGDKTVVITYGDNELRVNVHVEPKALTWDGNGTATAKYGSSEADVTFPALVGVVNGDTVNAMAKKVSVAGLIAGAYNKEVSVQLDNANYKVAGDLAVDVTITKATATLVNYGEKSFDWGEAIKFDIYAVDENGNKYPVVVTYDESAKNVGDYTYSVKLADETNLVLDASPFQYFHIEKKTFEVDFKVEMLAAGVITPTVSIDALPEALKSQVRYDYKFVEAKGAFGPYIYSVSVLLPEATENYALADVNGNVVTGLTQVVEVSHGNVALGTADQPVLVVLYSPDGYMGEVSATLAIPSSADFEKAIKGFRYHSEYTVTVNGAAGETFSVMIPVDAALVNRHCIEKATYRGERKHPFATCYTVALKAPQSQAR